MNLTEGRIVAVVSGIQQVAPVCTMHPTLYVSLGPPESSTKTASESVYMFLQGSLL